MHENEDYDNSEKFGKGAADKQNKEEKVSNEVEKKLEKVIIKEGNITHLTPHPFLNALIGKKNASHSPVIFELLKQVKVNITLLDIIKQVLPYAKFLKDLCTVKRGFNIDNKAFLIEQVSSIIENKTLVKYRDPGCPIILVKMRYSHIEQALQDLGASVNLLSYSFYKLLGLGELKPTNITLSLADRLVKDP